MLMGRRSSEGSEYGVMRMDRTLMKLTEGEGRVYSSKVTLFRRYKEFVQPNAQPCSRAAFERFGRHACSLAQDQVF
jgi:hypothetical protein